MSAKEFARMNPDVIAFEDDPPPPVARLRCAALAALLAGVTDSEIADLVNSIGPYDPPQPRRTVKVAKADH